MIEFTPGKFYRTRDGRKAKCLYVELSLPEANQVGMVDDGFLRSYYISGKYGFLRSYYISGRYYDDRESELDIISEWHEPVTVTRWIALVKSIPGKPLPMVCGEEHVARIHYGDNLLALKQITITEGEGMK